MAVNRIDRVNAEIKKALSETITYNLKEIQAENAIITITKVETTDDLKYCKIFLSIFPDTVKDKIFLSLKNSISFLRREVARKVKLRLVPELHLVFDDSLEYSQKIDKILMSLKNEEGK